MLLRNERVLAFFLCFLFLATGTQSQQNSTPDKPAVQQPGTAFPSSTPEQQAPPSINKEGGDFVIKKQVQEVVVHATVVDKSQRMVTDLDRAAFKIFEDGQQQNITSFRHEDIPVAMGIVIDNSGSMREKRDKVNRAALNLVRWSRQPSSGDAGAVHGHLLFLSMIQ